MKWEYNFLYPANRDLDLLMPAMKDIGNDGWELVSVDNGIAYFKRPNPEYQDLCKKEFEENVQKAITKMIR